MKLRKYQTPQVNNLIRQLTENQVGALVSAVGTGKTIVTSIVGGELINRGVISKVIVAAPFNTIVKEFPTLSDKRFTNETDNNGQYLIHEIKQSENITAIIDLIRGVSSAFISTSHAAMASSKISEAIDEIDDMSDTLVIIDEAHHCFASDEEEDDTDVDGTLLGELAKTIKQKGGKLLYVTATPYRTFRGKTSLIFDPIECNPVIRTIGEQMRDGYAPSLETEYVHVKNFKLNNAGEAGIFGDLSNTKLYDPQLNILLPKIIEQWKTENYPKTILLVPAGNAEHTSIEVKKQLESIVFPPNVSNVRGRNNPSVLVAVGPSNTVFEYDGKEMNEIEFDKAVCGRKYDIVIGCRKFDEGTDVSSASHIFMIGLPSSVRLFHQRTGRVLRDRKGITGYSEWFDTQWVGKSKVVFFAPAGRKTKDFDFKVGRQLLHCIFAAESYQEYCESLNASQNIRIAFESTKDKCKDEDAKKRMEKLITALSKVELKELKDYSEIKFDQLVNKTLHPNMTVGERVELIKASDLSVENKQVQYNNLLNHLPSNIKGSLDWNAMVSSIIKEFNKKPRENRFEVNPTEIISDVFEKVLNEFYNEKISSVVESGVQKVFSDISGETLQEWAKRCSRFMGESAGLMWINKICDHIDVNNNLSKSDSVLYDKLCRFKQIKAGTRTIGIWYASYDDLAVKRGYPTLFEFIDFELNAQKYLNKIIDFWCKHGREPSQKALDEEEKLLGYKLRRFRTAYQGTGSSIFYESLHSVLNDRNAHALFYKSRSEKIGLQSLRSICDFYELYKKKPFYRSIDAVERKIGIALIKLKEKKQKNKNAHGSWYSSFDSYLNQRGMMHLFDIPDIIKQRQLQIEQICDYMDGNNSKHPPSNTPLGLILNEFKKMKKRTTWDDSFYKIACDRGYPKLFDKIDKEQEGLDKLSVICDFLDKNGIPPSSTSKDAYEQQLARTLSNMRSAKNGKHTNRGVFHMSYIKLINDRGYPKLFDKIFTKTCRINRFTKIRGCSK